MSKRDEQRLAEDNERLRQENGRLKAMITVLRVQSHTVRVHITGISWPERAYVEALLREVDAADSTVHDLLGERVEQFKSHRVREFSDD